MIAHIHGDFLVLPHWKLGCQHNDIPLSHIILTLRKPVLALSYIKIKKRAPGWEVASTHLKVIAFHSTRVWTRKVRILQSRKWETDALLIRPSHRVWAHYHGSLITVNGYKDAVHCNWVLHGKYHKAYFDWLWIWSPVTMPYDRFNSTIPFSEWHDGMSYLSYIVDRDWYIHPATLHVMCRC